MHRKQDLCDPVSIQEASEYLGFSPSYIYKLIHKRQLPFYKPNNGKVYFKFEDLEAFVFQNRYDSQEDTYRKAEKSFLGGIK